MPNTIKFKRVSITEFHMMYEDAAAAIDETDVPMTLPRMYGVVQIAGYGYPGSWMPCVLNSKGKPSYFFDEDAGWNPVPKAEYELVK